MASTGRATAGDRGHGDGNTSCHSTGSYPPSVFVPWRGGQREADKTRLCEYVRNAPEGTPLPKIVSDVFGPETTAGDAEYQLARRFFARHSEFFQTDSRGDMMWIEPTLDLFKRLNLRQRKAKRKTSGRRRDGGEAADRDKEREILSAKERVQQYLDSHLRVESDMVRRSLFERFTDNVIGTTDKWQVFERVRGSGDQYLCLPYLTRYNDAGRATEIRDGFETALATAGNRHKDAVVLTLTTDPKEHEGLSEAVQSLSKNKGRLLSWLSTEYQLGYRPENLSVLEFTRSGLPHYHLVLFGVSRPVSQEQLAAKWVDYGQGRVVDIRTATNTHGAEGWLLHDDKAGKVSLRQYLGKAIRELVDVANSEPGDLRDRLEDGDISAWRQALYWATERQYYTCSPSLKESKGGDDLPHITKWRFVGTAEYHQIPAHVRQEATFHVGDRPPPAPPPSG